MLHAGFDLPKEPLPVCDAAFSCLDPPYPSDYHAATSLTDTMSLHGPPASAQHNIESAFLDRMPDLPPLRLNPVSGHRDDQAYPESAREATSDGGLLQTSMSRAGIGTFPEWHSGVAWPLLETEAKAGLGS